MQSLTRFAEEYGEAMSIRVLISETMRPSAQEGLNPEGLRDPIASGVIIHRPVLQFSAALLARSFMNSDTRDQERDFELALTDVIGILATSILNKQ